MAEAATESTPPKETKAAGGDKLSRDYLISHARALTGVSGHVVAGALAGEKGDEFTADQAKKAVDKFLGKEIDPLEGAPEEEAE